VTFESKGYLAGFGLEWPKKKQYVQLAYSVLWGKHPTTAGGSVRRIKIISVEKTNRMIRVQSVIVNWGFFVF